MIRTATSPRFAISTLWIMPLPYSGVTWKSACPYATGCAFSTMIAAIVPVVSDSIWFNDLHRLDDAQHPAP